MNTQDKVNMYKRLLRKAKAELRHAVSDYPDVPRRGFIGELEAAITATHSARVLATEGIKLYRETDNDEAYATYAKAETNIEHAQRLLEGTLALYTADDDVY